MAYPNTQRSVGSDLSALANKISSIPLVLVLFGAMLFFFLNGTYYWGAFWDSQVALVYIIMFTFAIAVTYSVGYKHLWISKTKFSDGVLNFWIGFLIGTAGCIVADVYLFGGSLAGTWTVSSGPIYPAIILTVLFVAIVEETIFRGVLKEALKKWKLFSLPLGAVITAALFAVFHTQADLGSASQLWFVFILGLILYAITEIPMGKDALGKLKKLGVPGSTGVHASFNLFVVGILPLILGLGVH